MKQTTLTQYDFVPSFFKLAIANILSYLTVPLASIVSVAFLGHLSDINQLTGVALASALFIFIYFVFNFLRMATTGVTAQAIGRNDEDEALLVGLRNGLIAIVLGLLILVLQYPLQKFGFFLLNAPLEVRDAASVYYNARIWGAPAVFVNYVLSGWFLGLQLSNQVLIFSTIGNVANIALCYLFVVRLGWESMGAGLSEACGQYLMLLVGLIFFCQKVKWKDIKAVLPRIWDLSAIKATFSLNGSISLNNLLMVITWAVFNKQGAAIGKIVFTENALIFEIFALLMYFVEGLGVATESFSGKFTGEGAKDRLIPLMSVAGGISFVTAIVFAFVYAFFPKTLFGMLTNHPEVIENIGIYAWWLLFVMGFASLAWILQGYFLGLAEANTIVKVSFISLVVGFLPLAGASEHFQNNHLLWLGVSLMMAIKLIGFGVEVPRTLRLDTNDLTGTTIAENLTLPSSDALDMVDILDVSSTKDTHLQVK